MFSYFFSYETNIPHGVGFGLYKAGHLIWMSCIALFLTVACLWFGGQNSKKKERILNLTVAVSLSFTAGQDVILAAIGQMNVQMLPLHLCDLAAFFYLFQRITKWNTLGEICICLLLPGAICAILFPNWTHYPMFNFMVIHGFVYHTFIILYPLLLLQYGVYPRFHNVWKSFVFLGCLVPPVYWFDRVFESNYMFLLYAPENSPLELLSAYMGTSGYLVGYAGTVVLILLGIYGLFELLYRIRKKYFPIK